MTSLGWTRRALIGSLAALPAGLPLAAHGDETFAEAVAAAGRIEQLNALVIVQHGRIAVARAFRGPNPAVPVNIKSVSKSLVSALAGIAIARHELSGTDQRIAPLLQRLVPRRADPRVRAITVGHLLTMRSGLQVVSGGAYAEWATSRTLIQDALSRPMVADPGTAMLYSTASYHILGEVLSRVSGLDLHALMQQRLGDPVGIRIPEWTRDARGRYLGGNDMALSPLAMARFGEMYRLGGTLNGQTVLAADWVRESWTPVTASVETGHGYGYGWFVWDSGAHRVFYARGYGGQMIYIVPPLALTVAITSDASRPAPIGGHLGVLNALLTEIILPAAETAV